MTARTVAEEHACERCRSALAQVWFWRVEDRREWQFCKHHAELHHDHLIASRYVVAKDTRDSLVVNRLQGEP